MKILKKYFFFGSMSIVAQGFNQKLSVLIFKFYRKNGEIDFLSGQIDKT